MLSNKSFHLHWNNHLPNLRTLLEYLYNEQSFVDVTLSCSDGLIRAHKLVLSACSPYFDTIFRENPCKHPTVILRGISLREMQLIIEYMYVGSVDIPENELPSLLEIANELHVKGLSQNPVDEDDHSDKCESPTNDVHVQDFKTELIPDSAMKESFTMVNSSSQNSVEDTEKKSPVIKKDMNTENQVSIGDNDKTIYGIMSMAQIQINMDESNQGESDKKQGEHNFTFEYTEDRNSYPSDLFCSMCNKGFLTKQNMKRHMQTHTGVKPHQCNYCNLSFLRLSHLQRHHRVHTGERPFQCDQCEKQFSRSDKLKQHISQHHSGVVVPKQPKQRGRPRKVPLNIPLNLASSPNQKLSSENFENMNNIPSFQTLQQIYNISNTLPGISVVQ